MSDIVQIPRSEFEALLNAAAERGATRALERVGLHDDKAGKDMNEMRTLLEMFRSMRDGALKKLGAMVMMGVLGLMAAGAVVYMNASR